MLSITVSTGRGSYMYDGRSGDIDLMVWPINFTLAYVGMTRSRPLSSMALKAAFATPISQRSTRGCKAPSKISATNSQSSTSWKNPFKRMAGLVLLESQSIEE
jgi:NAD(P)H dehydrogenase (quinone)